MSTDGTRERLLHPLLDARHVENVIATQLSRRLHTHGLITNDTLLPVQLTLRGIRIRLNQLIRLGKLGKSPNVTPQLTERTLCKVQQGQVDARERIIVHHPKVEIVCNE